ncbi:MAG TPA: hypothetical protein VEG60_34500, partial [Candidatus Binatia bacterium]|nr:hypothetical protein [Candidatus Binatia bacterium]
GDVDASPRGKFKESEPPGLSRAIKRGPAMISDNPKSKIENPKSPGAVVSFRGKNLQASLCPICPGNFKCTDREAYQRHMAGLHGEGYEERRCISCKEVYRARIGAKRRWPLLCDPCILKRRRNMGQRSADTGRPHRGVVIFHEGISQGYSRKKI